MKLGGLPTLLGLLAAAIPRSALVATGEMMSCESGASSRRCGAAISTEQLHGSGTTARCSCRRMPWRLGLRFLRPRRSVGHCTRLALPALAPDGSRSNRPSCTLRERTRDTGAPATAWVLSEALPSDDAARLGSLPPRGRTAECSALVTLAADGCFGAHERPRLKVLISAYACEPGRGSEPGVGWNLAKAMSRHHDIWVLTRANNRKPIEDELAARPVAGLRVVYYDLPRWARWWKRGGRGVRAYYHLWQVGAIRAARAAHRRVGFDLAHHATLVKYWAPAAAAFVGVPFVWGPVGGGESMPAAFFSGLSRQSLVFELGRLAARWLGERDPLVRATGRRAAIAIATTPETAARLDSLVRCPIVQMPEVALTTPEIEALAALERDSARREVVYVSVGRLEDLKGYHLSLRAFAKAAVPGSRYVLIGDGSARQRLQRLAERLGIRDRVSFLGWIPRSDVLQRLADADVFVHPSLHDSGGWATVEAMAAGLPVVVLGIGGPATQVTQRCGYVIAPANPEQVAQSMAVAMAALAENQLHRVEMGRAARSHIRSAFSWKKKAMSMSDCWLGALAAIGTADRKER
jgi:glycosyltransferase involved in cell wall biosynthesis